MRYLQKTVAGRINCTDQTAKNVLVILILYHFSTYLNEMPHRYLRIRKI